MCGVGKNSTESRVSLWRCGYGSDVCSLQDLGWTHWFPYLKMLPDPEDEEMRFFIFLSWMGDSYESGFSYYSVKDRIIIWNKIIWDT